MVRGRIGSLLEVGTGFHPELTGRENIYLNGSILGMKRKEIARKFEEIVAFSEIEQFLDTPVKRYSSGMYVRLAFSVAAHLEPEILVVDEVLAVGDRAFQQKCLGQMREVSDRGRTILFVSHNMSAVAALCSRVLAIENGRVIDDGDPSPTIRRYINPSGELKAEWIDDRPEHRIESCPAVVKGVRVLNHAGQLCAHLEPNKPFFIEIDYLIRKPLTCQVAFRLNCDSGETVFTTADTDNEYVFVKKRDKGLHKTRVEVPAHLLAPGQYHLLVALNRHGEKSFDLIDRVLAFQIDGVGSLKEIEGRLGYVLPLLPWAEV